MSEANDNLDSRVFNLYEKREKIYTRKIEGFYQVVRAFTGWPLLIGYFATPWINVNGHQAILFDLPNRQFHVFWLTFWPQDFTLLAWALMIAAFSLFFFTNLLGRVWCGYSCPQTVWTAIFMWAEQVAEGDRHARINLDKAPWTLEKVRKRFTKHFLWIGVAAATGITFIGYFYGIKDLFVDAYNFQVPLVGTFWVAFFTIATYVNAGWMREQVCKYMCPYARFQSAMFDKDTLLVSYNPARGEKRGPRKRGVDPASVGLGDCIDCTMCVQVCPTGIDIRDGLQYECINCAACVDACNDIMGKMGYEKGLIAYTTEHQLEGKKWTWKRPRLLGYGAAILIMVGLFTFTLLSRIPVDIDVLRSRGQLFQEVPGGFIQNTYTVKLMNKELEARNYRISVTGIDSVKWVPQNEIMVPGGKVVDIPFSVIANPDLLDSTNTEIEFKVEAIDSDSSATKRARFLGPAPLEAI